LKGRSIKIVYIILLIYFYLDIFGKALNLAGISSCFFEATKSKVNFAVKIIDLEKMRKNSKMEQIIKNAIDLKNPYLANYKESFQNENLKKFIVIEHLNGNLHEVVQTAKTINKHFSEEVWG
jgi:hypothetical protein